MQFEVDAEQDVRFVRRATPTIVSILALSDSVSQLQADLDALTNNGIAGQAELSQEVATAVDACRRQVTDATNSLGELAKTLVLSGGDTFRTQTNSAILTLQGTFSVLSSLVASLQTTLDTKATAEELSTATADLTKAIRDTVDGAIKDYTGKIGAVRSDVDKLMQTPVYTESEVDALVAAAKQQVLDKVGAGCPELQIKNAVNKCAGKAGDTCTVQCSGNLGATGKLTCLGSGWSKPLPDCVDNLGSEQYPAAHCKDIKDFSKAEGGNTEKGVAWFKLPGHPAFQLYCDNSIDGGGWGHVVYIDGNDEGTPRARPCLNLLIQTSGSMFRNGISGFAATCSLFLPPPPPLQFLYAIIRSCLPDPKPAVADCLTWTADDSRGVRMCSSACRSLQHRPCRRWRCHHPRQRRPGSHTSRWHFPATCAVNVQIL